MSKLFLIPILLGLWACAQNTQTAATSKVVNKDFQLSIPPDPQAVLVLFPCMPCTAQNTKEAFDIEQKAMQQNIAVLYMNFNQRLWLTKKEEKRLESILTTAFETHDLSDKKKFIGGFSSGGNIAMLLSNYLIQSKSEIQPQGVFMVDAPIDLLGLYTNAQNNIEKNYAAVAVAEAKWVLNLFEQEFGTGKQGLERLKAASPFVNQTKNFDNLKYLNTIKIRAYSEPDTTWWKENRQTAYTGMNAYYIEQFTNAFNTRFGANSVSYIQTQNKGYRANGERHPHSWSIVNQQDLIDWILTD